MNKEIYRDMTRAEKERMATLADVFSDHNETTVTIGTFEFKRLVHNAIGMGIDETLTERFIRRSIEEYCEENSIKLNYSQLRMAMKGVEYCLSEVMSDSVETAVDDVKGVLV